jgi:Na+-driven multidrug efflux pump
MKDLTDSSIGGHILQMAVPIAAGMFFQTLYFLIDLYFVAHLGDAASCRVWLCNSRWSSWAPRFAALESCSRP